MALWHRPKLSSMFALKESGCELVVTLMSEKEGARAIGEAAESSGMEWTWLPLEDSRPPEGRRIAAVINALVLLSEKLDAGRSVLVHCSAGMHRTGMITFALLRLRGHTEEEALDLIHLMRPHTRHALTAKRIAWGNTAVTVRHA
ncbi:MAG: dual specificity protein phosphatase family protein [Acidobacteria bacterium]|nr:dual specificity protein phosphatase family protein [Acidobacteriota bacterium]